ncbi:MAG: zf-HC2 domain-containing protein [Clostridium sp.]|nr:zf-HC2 domain-containing protein [Clostridium sp.]
MNITCNIIRDLLPLYQDGVLSDDSSRLVEEHLKQCPACQEYRKQLKEEIETPQTGRHLAGEQNALKRIKHTILYKRILSVVTAMALVMAAGFAGYYLYCEKERYVTYEESGVQVNEDGVLTVEHSYSKVQSIFSPDLTTQFFWVSNTAYERRKEQKESESGRRYVCEIGRIVPGESEISAPKELREVYYLPGEYQHFWFSDDAKTAALQVEEIKSKAHLIWEKEE